MNGEMSIVSMKTIDKNNYSIKVSVMSNTSILVCIMDHKDANLCMGHFTSNTAAKEYIKNKTQLRNMWES